MKYTANPVEVDAYKILEVGPEADRSAGERILKLDGGPGMVICDKPMMARYTPNPGDYWVIQSDGYPYLNPKEVFERKYSSAPRLTLELTNSQRLAALVILTEYIHSPACGGRQNFTDYSQTPPVAVNLRELSALFVVAVPARNIHAEHRFEPMDPNRDCSCGWKAEIPTVSGIDEAWKSHVRQEEAKTHGKPQDEPEGEAAPAPETPASPKGV
jgi:hypothetical protein